MATPSVAWLAWEAARGCGAKLSLGLGRLFNGASRVYDQPAEAWVRVPAGPARLSVGKLWMPFAAQEWLLETRAGALAEWEGGAWSLALAAGQRPHSRGICAYLRAGRRFGEAASVGISAAAGQGLSYGSSHDQGMGLDAEASLGRVRISGEHVALRPGGGSAFSFLSGRIAWDTGSPWTPFAAAYSWNDRAGELGRFRSTIYGITWQITPSIGLEAALAATSAGRAHWVQLSNAWEW